MSSGASQPQSRKCVSCGRDIAWDMNVCPYCGHDFRKPVVAAAAKKDSALPMVGGALIILGAIVYFYWAYQMIVVGEAFAGITLGLSNVLTVCGAIIAVLGVIALVGGVFGLMKRHYMLAVLGGVMAILSLIGLVGLILVIVSKEAFEE